MPAVSVKINLSLPQLKSTETASLVVPGLSNAIKRSSPNKELIRVDFPTFGRPTIEILGSLLLILLFKINFLIFSELRLPLAHVF